MEHFSRNVNWRALKVAQLYSQPAFQVLKPSVRLVECFSVFEQVSLVCLGCAREPQIGSLRPALRRHPALLDSSKFPNILTPLAWASWRPGYTRFWRGGQVRSAREVARSKISFDGLSLLTVVNLGAGRCGQFSFATDFLEYHSQTLSFLALL